MKIKKILALALAGTMVLSMTACGDDKESDKKSATSAKETSADKETSKGGNASEDKDTTADNNASADSDLAVEDVLDKIEDFVNNKDKNYSTEMYMKMVMSAEGMSFSMESTAVSKSYDGVKYTKTTSDSFGEKSVDEEYSIINEDGSVTTASKNMEDDEWDVYTEFNDDEDNESTLDIEKVKETATMKKKGDNYIVTMEVDAEDVNITDDDTFGDISGMKIKLIVTYNVKKDMITEMEVEFDTDVLTEIFAALGDISVDEVEIKITNIEVNDEPIEIPSEIELD